MLKRFFGSKAFYRRVLVLMLPIMIQNGITNLVNMLDNVMVGRVGTVEMTGVAVANQLLFVFNLCIFGAVSGAGIFGAQFYGNGDREGVRNCFRFKLIFCSGLALAGVVLFLGFGEPLVALYLKGEGSAADAAASLGFGFDYLKIMLIGLIPYTIAQCYSSTLRETGETLLPMYAGMAAVGINLALNYVLIFGHFGAPRMGVAGAAIATVVSRFAELFVVAFWTWHRRQEHWFIKGAYQSLRVPVSLIKQILFKGAPLMLNEAMWAAGIATLNQSYSVISQDVVAANNISQTFFNVFSVAFMAVGAAIGILVGQMLGAGEAEEAKDTARKLIVFSFMVSVAVGSLYALFAAFIPRVYNTTDSVRSMATGLMWITAAAMPFDAIVHASYFTLRSGGKVIITFLFDSCFVWLVSVPVAFVLSRFTSLNIYIVYGICQGLNLIKTVIGLVLVKKGGWVRNIVK